MLGRIVICWDGLDHSNLQRLPYVSNFGQLSGPRKQVTSLSLVSLPSLAVSKRMRILLPQTDSNVRALLITSHSRSRSTACTVAQDEQHGPRNESRPSDAGLCRTRPAACGRIQFQLWRR